MIVSLLTAKSFRVAVSLGLSLIVAVIFLPHQVSHPIPNQAAQAAPIKFERKSEEPQALSQIQLCQFCESCIRGVDCLQNVHGREPRWSDARPMPFQPYRQGEYVGPPRLQHLLEYRLRVDDQLEFVYRLTRESTGRAYELNIGDRVRIEVIAEEKFDRELEIQPDETIVLPYVGVVLAAGRTISELRADVAKKLSHLYVDATDAQVVVTPVKVSTKLEDLRAAVDSRFGNGGQSRIARVTPEGTIALPAIGSIRVQGLTLDELKYEIEERYAREVRGIEVIPVLQQRAPSFIFVLGDVRQPGRFTLERPTSVMGAIALAGSWNNGGNLRQIVVFRRTDDWRLIATKVDIRGGLYGQRPIPNDDIWLRDSDVIVVPRSAIKAVDEAIELLFTHGLYAALPGTSGFQPFTLTTFN